MCYGFCAKKSQYTWKALVSIRWSWYLVIIFILLGCPQPKKGWKPIINNNLYPSLIERTEIILLQRFRQSGSWTKKASTKTHNTSMSPFKQHLNKNEFYKNNPFILSFSVLCTNKNTGLCYTSMLSSNYQTWNCLVISRYLFDYNRKLFHCTKDDRLDISSL